MHIPTQQLVEEYYLNNKAPLMQCINGAFNYSGLLLWILKHRVVAYYILANID